MASRDEAFCLAVQYRPVFLGPLAAAIYRVAVGSDEFSRKKPSDHNFPFKEPLDASV